MASAAAVGDPPDPPAADGASAVVPPADPLPVPPPPSRSAPPLSYRDILAGSSVPCSRSSVLEPISIEQSTCFYSNGLPCLSISDRNFSEAASQFKLTLLAKFSQKRPTVMVFAQHIKDTWRLSEMPQVSLLDHRHFCIRFSNEDLFAKAWSSAPRTIGKINYLLFRWTKDFVTQSDPSSAPTWIRLPGLPLPFFNPTLLKCVGDSIGTFLCADEQTVNLTHPIFARICVELDLTVKTPKFINLLIGESLLVKQPVIVEAKMNYCTLCKLQGHSLSICRFKPVSNSERTSTSKDSGQGLQGQHSVDNNKSQTSMDPFNNLSVVMYNGLLPIVELPKSPSSAEGDNTFTPYQSHSEVETPLMVPDSLDGSLVGAKTVFSRIRKNLTTMKSPLVDSITRHRSFEDLGGGLEFPSNIRRLSLESGLPLPQSSEVFPVHNSHIKGVHDNVLEKTYEDLFPNGCCSPNSNAKNRHSIINVYEFPPSPNRFQPLEKEDLLSSIGCSSIGVLNSTSNASSPGAGLAPLSQ